MTETKQIKLTPIEWLFVSGGTVLFTVAIVALNVGLDAFVFKRLWEWFVVPAFGIGPVSTKTAIGISMLVALTSHQARKKGDVGLKDALAYHIGNPLMLLAVGWAVKSLL